MQEEVASINGDSFFELATLFTSHIHDLTAGGRHVLLTYDAFQSHMTLKVLTHLHAHNVVVYALPAHTRGKLQPCYVVVFGVFRREMNKAFTTAALASITDPIDVFKLCLLIKHAL